jgi:hypothetical protein
LTILLKNGNLMGLRRVDQNLLEKDGFEMGNEECVLTLESANDLIQNHFGSMDVKTIGGCRVVPRNKVRTGTVTKVAFLA